MLKQLMTIGAMAAAVTMMHHGPAAAIQGGANTRPAVIEAAASPSPVDGIIKTGKNIAGYITGKAEANPAFSAHTQAPAASALAWSSGTTWSDYYTDEQPATI